MKVGNLVKVKTKHYGKQFGLVVGYDDGSKRYPVWRIRPFNHPRDIYALIGDIEVVSETALCSPMGSGGNQ
tara:strand:- start:693 stop:905 length:213 start_codon:yes stop_codon:yes gene_type:complete